MGMGRYSGRLSALSLPVDVLQGNGADIGSSLYRAGGYGKRLLPARIFLLYFDKPDENTRFLRRKVLFYQGLADERE